MRDVKRDELRWMLKRVAMGVVVSPLALIAACSCGGGGGGGPACFPNSPITVTVRLSSTLGRSDVFADCRAYCGLPTGSFGSPSLTGCTVIERGMGDASVGSADATASYDDASVGDAGPDPIVAVLACANETCHPAGRRPSEGLAVSARSGTAQWLHDVARLEAASVDAFVELRQELVAHQAPRALIQETHRAEADEVIHAQLIGSFARRAGAKPVRPNVVIGAPRALFDIAKHNASEGCVREAYGAINALHQAHNASSAEVREGFLRIARDEARHALLSLELDDWMRTQLSAHQVRQLEEEREIATAELLSHVGHEDHETRAVLGLPDEERARDLVLMCA